MTSRPTCFSLMTHATMSSPPSAPISFEVGIETWTRGRIERRQAAGHTLPTLVTHATMSSPPSAPTQFEVGIRSCILTRIEGRQEAFYTLHASIVDCFDPVDSVLCSQTPLLSKVRPGAIVLYYEITSRIAPQTAQFLTCFRPLKQGYLEVGVLRR